ncbi:GH92 family glycosyl hydrolase [Reichenbachiella sp.]|uniref:GH92 family glycosyl hydrolase n=1 Tax=Reichenbachiella sp. TaxID=2184521 RepID=UPI00329A52CB
MKNISKIYFTLCIAFIASCTNTVPPAEKANLTQFVDPFIGTGGHGHTFPGASLPFGMVQPSPNNGTNGWDWCSGYHYSDSIIVGFSQTHLSGTGIGDLADILIMPLAREVDLAKPMQNREDITYRSAYNHDTEKAVPGFYSVYLPDNEVKVSLTAGLRCAMHKYEFDNDGKQRVVLDLAHAINWDKPMQTEIQVLDDSTITGLRYSKGWATDQRLHFAIRFSEPLSTFQLVDKDSLVNSSSVVGSTSKALFEFSGSSGNTLKLKVALSSANRQGALSALEEIQTWNFDAVKKRASSAWEDQLSKIVVESSDEKLKRIFYTALYHTQLAPMTYSDANGNYKGVDGAIHQSDGYTKHTIFSLWDTFRAAHPLYTIINEPQVGDFVNSMLAHYDESGLLPVWELAGNETNTMTGYHAVPVIVDAIFKGIEGFDVEKAYQAIKTSGMQDIRGVNFLKEYGYIPADLENESVTKNLEYAFDDWCIAQTAKKLGKQEDYKYFSERAMSYKKLYDPETKFMRGKLSDGSWKTPFDPKYSAHRVGAEYTEGNAWQHSWFVPHDVPGLIELMGGNDAFATHLDSLFNQDSNITGDNVSADISGLIGQYAHGNEPSHHIAYLYNYAGKPWKTQEMTRKIMKTMYNDQPDGLSGNEDCGQMSAWYVFSALGFYPVNPANGIYQLGSPLFERATINMGKVSFVIEANNVSEENRYVKSVSLNGKELEGSQITHQQVMEGGLLVFEMTNNQAESR